MQGSVLDPLLFTVHVDDIFGKVVNWKTFMLDEDQKIVYSFERHAYWNIEVKIDIDISSISNFAGIRLLALSMDQYFLLKIWS